MPFVVQSLSDLLGHSSTANLFLQDFCEIVPQLIRFQVTDEVHCAIVELLVSPAFFFRVTAG